MSLSEFFLKVIDKVYPISPTYVAENLLKMANRKSEVKHIQLFFKNSKRVELHELKYILKKHLIG